MFKFYRNGKEITPPKRIKWHFAGKPDAIFESAPEKLEINASFWRKKLEVSADAEIVFVKSDQWTMDLPKITPILEDECTTTTATTTNQPDSGIDNDGTDSEFSVSEEPEATVYTTKPKSKRKATKLPDVSAELDSLDSPDAE
jgi:hypothetical protein